MPTPPKNKQPLDLLALRHACGLNQIAFWRDADCDRASIRLLRKISAARNDAIGTLVSHTEEPA